MTMMMIGGLVLALAAALIALYNGLVHSRIKVDEAWADIDTFLKQRFDLIPNLVNTVKGYAKHERETLENLTKYRSMVANAGSMKEKAQADTMLTNTLKSLFAVAENYPDLKANTNFLDLQKQLTVLEEKLQRARRYYNGTVREYNTKIKVFPAVLVAGMLGFTPREFYEVADAEKENVKVEF